MANKTVVTIDYESGPNANIEVASTGALTEGGDVQSMTVTGKFRLLRICKLLDKFLRDNDIIEIRFKEEAE